MQINEINNVRFSDKLKKRRSKHWRRKFENWGCCLETLLGVAIFYGLLIAAGIWG